MRSKKLSHSIFSAWYTFGAHMHHDSCALIRETANSIIRAVVYLGQPRDIWLLLAAKIPHVPVSSDAGEELNSKRAHRPATEMSSQCCSATNNNTKCQCSPCQCGDCKCGKCQCSPCKCGDCKCDKCQCSPCKCGDCKCDKCQCNPCQCGGECKCGKCQCNPCQCGGECKCGKCQCSPCQCGGECKCGK